MKEILRFGFKTRFMGGMCPPALLAAAAKRRGPGAARGRGIAGRLWGGWPVGGGLPGRAGSRRPAVFMLVREPGDGTSRVATVSREPVNIHAGDAGPVDAAWRDDAEAAVCGNFDALERRDFEGAVRWVHPAWHDFTAMPEWELRSLRLLLTRLYAVYKVGRVVLLEYEVEAWARYPDFFTSGPHPRSTGPNIHFVVLAPLDPPMPPKWRSCASGRGRRLGSGSREMRGVFPGRGC